MIGLPRCRPPAARVKNPLSSLVNCVLNASPHVVADRLVVLEVAVPHPGEAVAARLDGDVQRRARHVLVGHVAGAAELELLERPEVEVPGVGARAFAGVDAFDARRVLLAHAVGHVAGLRAGVRAADVVAGDLESRRLRHRGPDVACVGNLGQQLLREIRPDRRGRRIDDRRFTGHRHGLLQRRHGQLRIQRQRRVDHDADVLAGDFLEAGQFEGQGVHAGRKSWKAIGAVRSGRCRLWLDERWACSGHRGARKDGHGVIRHDPVDSSAKFLRVNGERERSKEAHDGGELTPGDHSLHPPDQPSEEPDPDYWRVP